MIDKKKRRASWPAIENYFRRRGDHLVNKLNKTTMRRYYVERERPRGAMYDSYKPDAYIELSHFEKLILEPDASKEEWEQWFDPTSDSAHFSSHGLGLLEIQGGWENHIGWGFGENTLFEGRENEIYEYFYNIEGRKSTYPVSEDESVTSLLSLPSCIRYPISRIKINPHYIGCRFAESRFEEVSGMPSGRFKKYDTTVHAHDLASSMCAIEWAHTYSEKFDSVIKPMVSLCRSFYTDSNDTIKNIYESVVASQLDDWCEATGAGGTMTIAIRYETAEHLEAVIPLLTWKTRYPYTGEADEGVVKALPRYRDASLRMSFRLIEKYWSCGFEVNEYRVVNSNTLLIDLTIPLSRLNLYPLLVHLIRNSSNLEERLKSRKKLPG